MTSPERRRARRLNTRDGAISHRGSLGRFLCSAAQLDVATDGRRRRALRARFWRPQLYADTLDRRRRVLSEPSPVEHGGNRRGIDGACEPTPNLLCILRTMNACHFVLV